MKARNMLAAVVAAVLPAAAGAQGEKAAESVPIQGKDGKTIQAEVISADEDSVQIRRADGKEFDLPYARLSDESTKAIREMIAAREKAAAEEAAAKEAAKPVERAKVPEDPKSPDEIPEKVVVKKGSTVIATFTEAVDGLARPVIVEKEPEDGPFLRVGFTLEGDQTMLTMTSTHDRTVLVRCLARDKDQQNYYLTTILPLDKGVPSFESLGDEVEELVFYDFRFEKNEEDAAPVPAEETPEPAPGEKPEE